MARRRYNDDFWYPPTSTPIRTDKGIKAKSQRGDFGASWWAKRWIGVLEQFGWGNRLTRGRSYARKGQVLSIAIGVGKVSATVQGSRPRPYNVTLTIQPLSDTQWEQVGDALAQQAIFAAKLLAGEMPQDIEEAFVHAGVPLFPRKSSDIEAQCSCPDFANPCKHIAAVYYLLGEQFDEDPFLIFRVRGRTREQVMEMLQSRRIATAEPPPHAIVVPSEPVAPLADSLSTFYEAGDELEAISAHIAAPERDAMLLQRGSTPPLHTENTLRKIYQTMTTQVLARVFGEG